MARRGEHRVGSGMQLHLSRLWLETPARVWFRGRVRAGRRRRRGKKKKVGIRCRDWAGEGWEREPSQFFYVNSDFFLNVADHAGEMSQWLEHVFFFQRTQGQFPSHTWWLTNIHDSSSKVSEAKVPYSDLCGYEACTWCMDVHIGTHTYRQNAHMHKKSNKSLKYY